MTTLPDPRDTPSNRLLHAADCPCCTRARARISELTHASDLRKADLESRVAKYDAAFVEARLRTAHLRADWAAEPWKNEPGSFFHMNAPIAREALASLVYDLAEAKAALDRSRAEREGK